MIERIKKLKNNSGQHVVIIQDDGFTIGVPPGGILENINITNLAEIKDRVSVTIDLTEVMERKNGQGRTKLRD